MPQLIPFFFNEVTYTIKQKTSYLKTRLLKKDRKKKYFDIFLGVIIKTEYSFSNNQSEISCYCPSYYSIIP